MGRKIFVSYKYADGNVYPVPYISDYQPKVRDYVTWLEKKFTDRTEHIYKGEHDNEDLSDKSDEYIWTKLKDKIYDSTITIVLISPNMKEAYKWDRSQWIPWEIAYSVRETTRNDYTSHANAVLGVILPDRNNGYGYYHSMSLFRAQPKTELSKFINAYKSASSRLLKKEYPEIREKLWKEAFWSQSFCLLTAGGAPVEVIRQYIETQGEKKH